MSHEESATLLALRQKIDAVCLGLYNPDRDENITLNNLDVHFLDGEAGVLTEEIVCVAPDSPDTMGDKVAERVRDYTLYRRSAEKNACWQRNRHSAKQLIEELTA